MAEAQLQNENEILKKKLEEQEIKLKGKDADIEEYKKRIAQLESIATQVESLKNQRVKDAEDVDVLKTESETTLTKAKGVIFEKVKIIKNQELQIEAYSQQIESLKDVIRITKDLLEIRNLEVKQLENKINCMEERIKAEKERQDLMHKKLETMIRHNGELKREYEAQLCLFTALRERYSERELAKDVVDDMRRDVEEERVRVQQALSNAAASASAKTSPPEPLAAENSQAEEKPIVENNQPEKTNTEDREPEKSNADNCEPEKSNGDNSEPEKSNADNSEPEKSIVANSESEKTKTENNQAEVLNVGNNQPEEPTKTE